MTRAQRALLLLLAIFLGAFGGRLMGHQVADRYSLPSPPDPQRWRIISAGLSEGIGRTGVGRVSHIAGGALNLATHVFIRPDMAVPQFVGDAARIGVELSPDSGPLWIQLGPPPGKFVQLQPGGIGAGVDGQQWTPMADATRFELEVVDGQLWVSGGGQRILAGAASPGAVELSSVEEWAKIQRLVIADASGQTLFEEDFRTKRVPARVLTAFTAFGALLGLSVAWLLQPLSMARLALAAALLIPPGWAVSRQREAWLYAVERLYLDAVAPSALATAVLVAATVPLVLLAILTPLATLGRVNITPRVGVGIWVTTAAAALLYRPPEEPWSWSLLGLLSLSAVVFAGRRAVGPWWVIDAGAWLSWAIVPAAAFLLGLVRLVSVASTAGLWVRHGPRSGLGLLAVGILLVPLGAELWARGTVLDAAWRMERLTGERANERGWENPSPGWTGRCGDEQGKLTRVAVGGGSSVGGAYQFSGEPEAFFTAVAHETLCEQLPDGYALRTHNFGDGDRNTFTISRTIDAHLEDADILVLYVGVNDILTKQNRLTRKQREAAARARLQGTEGLLALISSSRIAVGASLWLRGAEVQSGESVADVPLPDARENHQTIIDAAQARGIRVLLMTEYAQAPQRQLLWEYARMQSEFAADDVQIMDVRAVFEGVSDAESLADRNHLSRAGNTRLGQHLAGTLQPWVIGSSR